MLPADGGEHEGSFYFNCLFFEDVNFLLRITDTTFSIKLKNMYKKPRMKREFQTTDSAEHMYTQQL